MFKIPQPIFLVVTSLILQTGGSMHQGYLKKTNLVGAEFSAPTRFSMLLDAGFILD